MLGFIVFSLIVRLISSYTIARFSNMRAYTLSSQLLENYLRQPYPFFLNRNSASICKSVLIEVDHVIMGALIPSMRIIANSAVVLSLLLLLFLIEPVTALLAAGLFGGSYVVIFILARRTLSGLGEVVLRSNHERYKIAHESVTGIKDVKILGVEEVFLRQFRRPALRIAEAKSFGMVVGSMPRYILETIAIGGTLVLILFQLSSGTNTLTDILPTLGVFAFAGVRLFPALQQVYRPGRMRRRGRRAPAAACSG